MTRIGALTILLSIFFFSCTSAQKEEVLNPRAFKAKMGEQKEFTLLDVRTPDEFKEGYISGAKNINWNDAKFSAEVAKLDKSKPVFVYCKAGGRSAAATNALKEMGFKQVFDLEGGISNWTRQGLNTTSEKDNMPKGMSMKEFHKLIDSDKLVLVDFYATWCTPCKQMDPFLKEIADEQQDKLTLIKLNADDHTKLTEALNISGLPTILLYKDKKLKWSYVGFMDKQELLKKISIFN